MPSVRRSPAGVTSGGVDQEHRLALLLADGTGDFDFLHLATFEQTVVLEGYVKSYGAKRRAEELARHVGFGTVVNSIRVYPGERAEGHPENGHAGETL